MPTKATVRAQNERGLRVSNLKPLESEHDQRADGEAFEDSRANDRGAERCTRRSARGARRSRARSDARVHDRADESERATVADANRRATNRSTSKSTSGRSRARWSSSNKTENSPGTFRSPRHRRRLAYVAVCERAAQ